MRIGERALEQTREPCIAFDYAVSGERHHIVYARCEHDFVAESLFPIDEQSFAGERLAFPGRIRKVTIDLAAAAEPLLVRCPAACEVAFHQQRVTAVDHGV